MDCKVAEEKPLTLDEAIAHVEEHINDTQCGQQRRQLADWLKELRAMKQAPVANVAAWREALEYVLRFDASEDAAMDDGLTDGERISELADHIEECQEKVNSALSKPVRNCDLFGGDKYKLHSLWWNWTHFATDT